MKAKVASLIVMVLGLWVGCLQLRGPVIFAQEEVGSVPREETLEGIVSKIEEEKEIVPVGAEESQLYQKLEVLITKGSKKNQRIHIESGLYAMSSIPRYQVNDELVIAYTKDFEGNDTYTITDYVRREALLWLFAVFAVLAILIGGWRGASSLVGMGVSFLVIFKITLVQIAAGSDPVLTAILSSLLIIPATFFLSHGINKKP